MSQRWIPALALASVVASFAQSAGAGEVLRSLEVLQEGSCFQTHIRLSFPVRAEGGALSGTGTEVAIPVELIRPDSETTGGDALSAEAGNIAGLQSVAYESTPGGGRIVLRYSKPVDWHLTMEAETQHLRIDASNAGDTACGPAGRSVAVVAPSTPGSPLEAAKSAIAARDFATAHALLADLLKSADADVLREATELEGVALEGEGKLAEAKARYQTFLETWPGTEAATRIRERLAALAEALAPEPAVSFAASDRLPETEQEPSAKSSAALTDNRAVLRGTIADDVSLASLSGIAVAKPDPDSWHENVHGSVGQSWYGRSSNDDSRLISSAGVRADGEDAYWRAAARFDALAQNQMGPGPADDDDADITASFSTGYLELYSKTFDIMTRVGRQSRQDGGIFGRFDGAFVGFEASDGIDIGVAAGSPVYLRNEPLFENDTYFLSARATFELLPATWFADVYAIEQLAGGIVDREAVGAEVRHEAADLSAAAGADYDVHLATLGSAYASGSLLAGEHTTINVALDYRTTPFLLTSNALSGQDADKLPGLVKLLGEDMVLSLASDRTAHALTASAGLSTKLSDKWQLSFDALWAKVSGTAASGGIDAIAGSSADLYLSAYLYGDAISLPDDSVGAGLAFTGGPHLAKLSGDVFWRYPIAERIALTPRLRVSLQRRNGETSVKATPGIGVRYRIDKHWLLESELGVTFDAGAADSAIATETQAIVGYRYEF